MVRLTFKNFLKEAKRLETDDVYEPTMRILDRNDPESIKQDRAELANFQDVQHRMQTAEAKPSEEKFDLKEIEKAIVSGGSAKEAAQRSAKTKRDNSHFGPAQFYTVPLRLQSPSARLDPRAER
jgi:hypothetical protein